MKGFGISGGKHLRSAITRAVWAALAVPATHVWATDFVYNPDNAADDLWSTGAGWTPSAPVSGPGTALTFVGANGTVLPSGLTNINTDDLPGSFALNTLNFQGAGPATGGKPDTITLSSADPSTGLGFVRNGATGPTINLNANLGTLANGLTHIVAAPISLNADTIITGAGTATFNFVGPIGGAGALTKTGSSTVLLSGASTFSGGVTLNAGTLRFGASSEGTAGSPTSGPLGTGTITLAGGAITGDLLFSGFRSLHNPIVIAGDTTIGGVNTAPLQFTGPVALTGTRALTINSQVQYDGDVHETGGSFGFIKKGEGVLSLNGTNSWTGPTVVDQGTLQLATAAGVPGTGATITVNAGATLLGLQPVPLDYLLSRIVPSSAGTLAGANTSSVNLDFTNYPNLHFGATGVLRYSGTITPAGGVYRLGAGGNRLELFNANTLTGARSVDVGVGSTGVLWLNAANDFTGPTTVGSGGTLWISHPDAIAKSGGLTVQAGGTVLLRGDTRVVGQTITLNGIGGPLNSGALSIQSPGTTGPEWAGPVILGSSGATLGVEDNFGTPRPFTVSGVIDDRPAGNTTNAFDLVVQVSKFSTNSGSVVLTASNTYHGNTIVSAGELKIDGGNDRLPAGTTVILGLQPFDFGATFNLNGRNQRVAGLLRRGRGDRDVVTNSKGLTTSLLTIDSTADGTFDGTVTDTFASNGAKLGFAKAGAGTFTLAGTNTYAGATTVSAGTLRVTSSIASSSGVTVAGGTFDVAATQTLKTLTVGAGAAAKVSAGVLTVGNNTTTAPLDLGVSGAGGQLDLTTRGLIVDYAAGAGNDAAAVTAVRAQVVAAYHGHAWDGRGITSSAAAANLSAAVGYALASETLGPTGGTFMGKSGVDATGVLVRYTLAGDANLDGAVDFNDLVRLAQNYNSTVSSRTASWWFNGDFNYDGVVNFSDLVPLAQNYNGTVPAASTPGPLGGAFASDFAAALAQAPEPTTTAWLAATALLRRRRRPRP